MTMNHSMASTSDRLLPGHIHRLVGGDTDWDALAAALDAAVTSPPHSNSQELTSSSSPSATSSATQGIESASGASPPSLKRPASAPQRTLEAEVHPAPEALRSAITPADRVAALRDADTMDMTALKKIAWAGLPHIVRPDAWRLLVDYMPSSSVRRAETLARKRTLYRDAVEQHYSSKPAVGGAREEDATIRQISVDIPRTSPGLALFHIKEVQAALERVLYVWATRHPSSGYVQGMNDLVTPFFFVFLSEFLEEPQGAMKILQWDTLEERLKGGLDNAIACAEADSYWCLTALLSDIQDYYTFAQPGIQRRVQYLRDLVGRVDAPLRAHLEAEGVDFIQFAFRWMNCLLMREIPFPLIVRIWDTYLAEPDGFALFHVYVCAALLVWFSDQLQQMEFQDMVMFLQNLPTQDWSEKEIDVILSQAYMWRTIFGAAPSHLQQS